MKNILPILLLSILFGCTTSNADKKAASLSSSSEGDLYFNYSIDGKEINLNMDEVLTSYNEFSATDREFKIYAGKDDGPNLLLTITADMSKPSSTPNGSADPGNKIAQGSVSLQNYPEKGLIFNSYDFLLNPKPVEIPGAILVTQSEKDGESGRIITGSINVTLVNGENKQNDLAIKDHVIKGKFRIKHKFNGRFF